MRGVVVGKAYNLLEGFEQNRYYADWVKGEEIIEEVSKIGRVLGK